MMREPAPGRAELLTLGLLCFFAVLSDLAYAGLTPLVVAYNESLHVDLMTAGWLASAEGAGFTLGAFMVAVSGRFFSRTRTRVVLAFAVLAAAQLLSAALPGAWLLAAYRAVSGTAAGLIYAVGVTAISASRNPGRGFAIYFGAIFVAGILALGIIPTTLHLIGLRGFYVAYGILIIVSLWGLRGYPIVRTEEVATPSPSPGAARGDRRWASGLLLGSIFLNFIFNGGLWVLAEHFGLQIPGTDAQSLGGLLAGTMLFALLGTALATLVAQRWTPLKTIVIGNLALIAAVVIMSRWHAVPGLITAMAILNMAVTFLTPATLTALAAQSEHGAQWGNLASQAGYSIGPAAIALITAQSGMNALVNISVAGFAGSAALAWLSLAKHARIDSLA